MDVEKRLLLAADPLKRAVNEFDGAKFSEQLYAKLGIAPSDEETGQGVEADHSRKVGLQPGGHRDQG